MAITRAQAPDLLEPKLSEIWNDAYPLHEARFVDFCNVMESGGKKALTTFRMTGFGTLQLKGEAEAITSDDPIFGGTKVFTPVRFALQYSISQEMLDHELYGQVNMMEEGLMRSAIDHVESVAANVLNGAFGTTDADGYSSTGFDSLQLCSTAHTRLDGGSNRSNRPGTDVDLGVTALQNAIINFANTKDDRGKPVKVVARKLVISPEDIFTAEELLGSEYKPGTANNDINALRKYGLTYRVNEYKTNTDDWFVFGEKHGVKFIWDVRPRAGFWDEPGKEVLHRKVVQGFFVGHDSWVGTYGSSGG